MMDLEAVTTGAVRRTKLQSNCHHQQTNAQPDVLPVTEPTVSGHWREYFRVWARHRNDLYCVEWDVKLYYTIPYSESEVQTLQ